MRQRSAVLVLTFTLMFLVLSSTHVFAQFISIPFEGETTSKAIQGNAGMIINAFEDDTGRPLGFDAVSSMSEPDRVRLEIHLFNMAISPEADATLGVDISTTGYFSFGEWDELAVKEKPYNEKSRNELRRPASTKKIEQPARWIPAFRNGEVEFPGQKKGQNGPLVFTGYIKPEELKFGYNVFAVRVHGIMEERKESPSLVKIVKKLFLSEDGKSVFGTYEEPWIVRVGEDESTDPVAGDRVTPQELQLALDNRDGKIYAKLEEICAMLGAKSAPVCKDCDWQAPETNSDQPPAPVFNSTPTMPDAIGIKFDHREGTTVGRQGQVKVAFDPGLSAGSWVEVATFANGQWWPWQRVSGATTGLAINLAKLKPGQIALTVAVRGVEGKTLGFAQLNLNLEER